MAGRMPGVHLSAQGQAEAEAMAERMAGAPLSAIYSSPLERAQETAAPLAAKLGLEIETSDALNEVNFGSWAGMDIDQLHHSQEWQAWNANRSCGKPPHGEMLVEIQSRMVTKIEFLRCAHPGQHVALVSHSDTIRAALAFYLGLPVDLCFRIAIDPASVSVIRLTDTHPEVVRVNDAGNISA